MKSLLITGLLLLSGIFCFAQKKTTNNSGTPAAKTSVALSGTATSFESTLVQGTLSFIKAFKQGDAKDFVPVYSVFKNDASFNGRKPVQVSLSKESFDSVFTKTTTDLSAKWPQVTKYIESNRISLTTERGWIDILSYFNSL